MAFSAWHCTVLVWALIPPHCRWRASADIFLCWLIRPIIDWENSSSLSVHTCDFPVALWHHAAIISHCVPSPPFVHCDLASTRSCWEVVAPRFVTVHGCHHLHALHLWPTSLEGIILFFQSLPPNFNIYIKKNKTPSSKGWNTLKINA